MDKLRSKIRKHRYSIKDNKAKELEKLATQAMFNFIKKNEFKSIALYLSFDGELETRPLINKLLLANINVYLPIIHPFSKGYLLFSKYDSSTELTLNRYKILEPKLNITKILNITKLDLLIVPLVAFTMKGYRVGMGGGYYDRTFQDFDYKKITGFSYDFQEVNNIKINPWDIKLGSVITPTKFLKFD